MYVQILLIWAIPALITYTTMHCKYLFNHLVICDGSDFLFLPLLKNIVKAVVMGMQEAENMDSV